MTARARTAVWAAALAGPLAFFPLIRQPIAAVALVVALAAVLLAARSIAWPLGLAGLPALLVGLTGTNPLPKGGVTFLFFSWTVLAVAIAFAREGRVPAVLLRSPAFVLTGLLTVWLAARLASSHSTAYGMQKVELFLLLNVVNLFAGAAIARRYRDFRLLLLILLVMAAVNAAVLAQNLATGTAVQVDSSRYTIAATYDPIGFGRAMGLGILIAVYLLLVEGVLWRRVLALATLPVLVLAFFSAGSRGPVVGLGAGAIVLLALGSRSRQARRRLLALIPAALVGAVLVGQLVPGETVTRIFSFLTGSGGDTRGEDRLALWQTAWRTFGNHPLLGVGTGGFDAVTRGAYTYPHNLLLEAASELGAPGLVLVLALLAVAGREAWRAWRGDGWTLEGGFALALLVFATLNSMFSADVSGNGDIWLAAGLATGLGRRAAPAARRERGRGDTAVPQPPQAPAPADPGAVVFPEDGAAVAGVVPVAAAPARTGWGVGHVTLQFSRDGARWEDVPEQPAAFDVVSGSKVHAVVRSRPLADALAGILAGEQVQVRPSSSAPWRRSRRQQAAWDTRALEDGAYRLRALTVDLVGGAVASPAVGVTVDNTAPTARVAGVGPGVRVEAWDGGSGLAGVRFERWHDGAWHALETVGEPPYTLAAERAADGAPVRAVALDRAGNETPTAPVAVGRTLTAAELERLRPAARPAAAAAGGPDLRLEALDARERALRATATGAAARERRLAHESAELESARQDVDARAAALRELESELARREQTVARAEAAAAELLRELEARAGELDDARQRLEGRDAAIRKIGQASREREARLAQREERLADTERLREVLERRGAALAERARELDELERSVRERERRAAVEPRPAPEREPRSEPVPAPAPEPVAPPAPAAAPPAAAASADALPFWALERLVAERPDPDPLVQEEREAMLFHLRPYVAVDGAIPAQFDQLVAEIFGPLLVRP